MLVQKISLMLQTNGQIHPGGAITTRNWGTLRICTGSCMEDH